MKPTPGISRRSVLRALTVSAAVAGTAFAMAATSSPATAAPTQVAATRDAGLPPSGHRHLIGVLWKHPNVQSPIDISYLTIHGSGHGFSSLSGYNAGPTGSWHEINPGGSHVKPRSRTT